MGKTKPQRWVIFGYVDENDDQPLFWANEDGWVTLESATVFLSNDYNLPCVNGNRLGVWVKLP